MTSKQLGDFDVFNFGKEFPFAIGFDRTLQLLNNAGVTQDSTNYPPYNIVKHDAENFSIELAVAGFSKDQISITKEKAVLTIEGKSDKGEDEMVYIHKGLASRNFKRKFTLADDIKVESSEMIDGILLVYLAREIPEEDKPQTIEIS